jgi:flagellar hook-associated protein 1 FlgK
MGGLFDTLGLGGQALQAQQMGAQITGANVGNANAPGYHREDAHMTSASAYGGVQAVSLQRAVDTRLEQQVNAQSANVAFANGRTQGLYGLVRTLGDMGSTGLGAAVNGFFAGWRNLSVHPEDKAVRTDTLARTQALVERVNTMARDLTAGQAQADSQIAPMLEQANGYIDQVAQLNVAINGARSAQYPAADMQDARDLAVQRLAELVGATSNVDTEGDVSVFVGGVSVVSEDVGFHLLATQDSVTGLHHVTVEHTTQGSLDARITGGTLGAQLALRDGDLAQSLQQLDQFVTDLRTAVNTEHAAGYGFDGVTGRKLFAAHAPVSGSAQALALDTSVAGNPDALAAAAAGVNSPGDNTVAARITALSRATLAGGNTQTASQAVALLVSRAGQSLSQSQFTQSQAQHYLDQTQTLWQQANGVSLQDQMLQLTRYQSAFAATTKLISVVEEMMQSLQRM